jgi:hypothetical protein
MGGKMKGKIGGVLVLLLGLLLVAAGLVLKFAVLPMMAVWPDDVDSTRTYEGTLVTMLNPAALQTMDLTTLFLENVPITVNRHVTTEQVEGNKALVLEAATMFGPDGNPIQPTLESWYTIDRRTTEHIPNFTDNPNVQDQRQGLVIGFPIGTEKRTYDGWSDDYQAVVPVEFVAEEEHEGMATYHFTSSGDAAEEKDPVILAMFPASLPKALLSSLAPMLDLPPALLEGLAALLPMLPDPVPLNYVYEYETHYWVEPTTGVLIDYTKDEARYLSLATAQVEVYHLTYEATDQSIADAKNDAEDGKGLINLFGTIIPYAAIGVGAAIALGGLFMLGRKKKAAA